MNAATFLQFDFAPLLIGIVVAAAAAALGVWFMLRREAMFADAIGHAVLPGFVLAFAVTGVASALTAAIGAVGSALAAALSVRFLERAARLDRATALGVVFTSFFAAGILLLEQTGASGTNFDIHAVLFGNLETLTWLAAQDGASLLDPAALAQLPPILVDAALAAAATAAFLALARKELALSAFDEGFAVASGAPARGIGMALAALGAVVAVVSLRVFGLIPTLALFVCPAAAARMATDRLDVLLVLAIATAMVCVVLGYVLATLLPAALGMERALNAAGSIAVTAGLLQTLAMLATGRRIGPQTT